MQKKKGKSGSIAKIHLLNFDDLMSELLELQNDEVLRAVVLIVDFEKIEIAAPINKQLPNVIKNFPVPIISAVSGKLPEQIIWLIENSHLCFASDSNEFDEVETEALAMAEKISELAPLAVRACLKAVNQGLEMDLDDGLKLETELFVRIFATEDMREGTLAFLEKRPPVFRGK